MSKRNHITLLLLCMAPVALSATVNKVPEGFTRCANDFEICETTDNWTGYYGANNTFVEIAGSKSFTCLPQTFGINDPLPNVQKSCFIKNTGLMACVVDGERCDIVSQWAGQYGANVNASHENGPRPLDLAIRQNCTEAVTILEAAGAVVADPVPPPKKTYANLAFAAVEADEATINEKIANGFRNDINRQSSRGHTALLVAVDYQNVGAVKF